MIGDDAKSEIDLFLSSVCRAAVSAAASQRAALRWQRAGVFFAAQFFDLVENRAKNIGLVIRNCSGKIGEIFRALNYCDSALETHSCIDVALAAKA